VCSDRTGSNGPKLEHRKFYTSFYKNFFTVRMTQYWKRLPREVVESASMEIVKTCLDAYLCSILEGTCFSRGVGLNDLLRSFPTPVIL